MRKRIKRQRYYSTRKEVVEKYDELRKLTGKVAALEKEAGEDPKHPYFFLFGTIPRKLTPSEEIACKEAKLDVEYLNEREFKQRMECLKK